MKSMNRLNVVSLFILPLLLVALSAPASAHPRTPIRNVAARTAQVTGTILRETAKVAGAPLRYLKKLRTQRHEGTCSSPGCGCR